VNGRDDLPPAGDPGGSARQAAHERALREFVSPGELPDGARMAEAEAALQKVLEREIPELREGAPETRPVARARRAWWADLWSPRARLVFATMAVIVVGAWLAATWTRTERAPAMRGTPGPADLLAPTSQELPGGTRRLEWERQTDALDYTVVFVAPDLHELARVPGVTDTHLDLRPGALPSGLGSGQSVMWRVIAMRGRDELTRSGTMVVTLP